MMHVFADMVLVFFAVLAALAVFEYVARDWRRVTVQGKVLFTLLALALFFGSVYIVTQT